MATTGESKMTKQSTKATTATQTATPLAENDPRLYGHLLQNGNSDLYDMLTLHREQLGQLETLITQVKKELSDTGEYEHFNAKTFLGIAQYLALNFLDDTQSYIERISTPATHTKQ